MVDNEFDLDKLNQEVYDNVRSDRKRMKDIIDKLSEVLEKDPLAAVGSAEISARLQDCMTKSNAQLVELLRISAKKNPSEKGLSADKNEELFDAIEKDN